MKINSIAFSNDNEGAYIAAGGSDGILRVYNVEKDEKKRKRLECIGHVGAIKIVRFSPCNTKPNSLRVVTASEDRTVRVWELELDNSLTCP